MRAGTFDPGEETPRVDRARNAEWFELSTRDGHRATCGSEFVAARQRMVEEFGAMPELTPEAWEWFEESGPLHYAKHVEDLRTVAGVTLPARMGPWEPASASWAARSTPSTTDTW